MHSLLKRYIQNNITVSTDQLEQIVKLFKPKSVKRNAILLAAGDVCKELYFVNKGCIRTYYISKEGKERTRYIAFDGIIGTALSSFIANSTSFEFVDALEDSELLCISRVNFYQLIDEIPESGPCWSVGICQRRCPRAKQRNAVWAYR